MMWAMITSLLSDEQKHAFGQRLKDLRKRKALTMKEVASSLGVQPNHYGKYEAGMHLPPIEKVVALGEMFSVSLDYLILGKTSEQTELTNTGLAERLRRIQEFDRRELEVTAELLDALIAKHRLTETMKPIPV